MILLALKYWKWIAGAVLILSLVIGLPLAKHHYDATQQRIGYDKRASEDKVAADKQAQANRDLQRQAELRYEVKREAQDRYFTTTVREIVHEPLPACPPLPESVRLRVNAAIDCAVSDSAASCGLAPEVPGAAEAAGSGDGK